MLKSPFDVNEKVLRVCRSKKGGNIYGSSRNLVFELLYTYTRCNAREHKNSSSHNRKVYPPRLARLDLIRARERIIRCSVRTGTAFSSTYAATAQLHRSMLKVVQRNVYS